MWQRLWNLLGTLGHFILDFLMSGAELLAQNGGTFLIESAQDAVAAAENTGGDGAAKRAAAIAAVISDLTSKGVPIVMNAINLAIENAVAKMNAAKTAVVSEPVAEQVVSSTEGPTD